jgi:hypothetical protein
MGGRSVVDWITTKITSHTEGLPMITLSLRDVVRNAAAVFSGCYGAVTRRAQQSGCSRQAIYDQARRVERLLQDPAPSTAPAEAPDPAPISPLDEPTRRRLAVTAFAMGISTRQIEDLFRVLVGEDGPDHSTIARWVADAAEKAEPLLRVLDAACVPEVRTLAVDEIFFGGDRPWSGSSRPA